MAYSTAKGRSQRVTRPAAPSAIPVDTSPAEIIEWYAGVRVPDPITFVLGGQYLNRPNLYPRQATILKILFLRDDLFTDYDHMVIGQWIERFRTEGKGCPPDVYERIAELKRRGFKWFREVALAIGRRGGKGYISALAIAYVMWHFMAKGDPQEHYGIDRDKQLECLIFAGKKEQAKAYLFADLYNVITGSACYGPYVSSAQTDFLTVYAPHDRLRIKEMADRGIRTTRDMASFVIKPKESTALSGRGPASFCQGYDEAAHVTKTTAKADAQTVYDAATPSLDQFGKDGFIVLPSSTWERLGLFYSVCQQAQENDDGVPVYPSKFMLQLTSWDPYEDWQIAHEIDLLPPGFCGDLGEYDPEDPFCDPPPRLKRLRGAIQAFDQEMRELKQANPDTFAVERESEWAAVMDAYLNEENVKRVFEPWLGRPERYGRPQIAEQRQGVLSVTYKAHGDPAEVNCNFGLAVAHEEYDDEGRLHCVFDLIKFWRPQDFPRNTMDYDVIMDWIHENVVLKFYPEELTFDQFNSVATVQREQKAIRNTPGMPKRVNVFEKTATATLNWNRFETAKAAINMGFVHAPNEEPYGAGYEQARLELTFLQKAEGSNRIVHPTSGPVQSKDVADCVVECIYVLLGEQMNNFLNKDLRGFLPEGALREGVDPLRRMDPANDTSMGLSGFLRTRNAQTGGRVPNGRQNPPRPRRRR